MTQNNIACDGAQTLVKEGLGTILRSLLFILYKSVCCDLSVRQFLWWVTTYTYKKIRIPELLLNQLPSPHIIDCFSQLSNDQVACRSCLTYMHTFSQSIINWYYGEKIHLGKSLRLRRPCIWVSNHPGGVLNGKNLLPNRSNYFHLQRQILWKQTQNLSWRWSLRCILSP